MQTFNSCLTHKLLLKASVNDKNICFIDTAAAITALSSFFLAVHQCYLRGHQIVSLAFCEI